MYGLPQAGHLAHNQLVKHLALYGYTPAKFTLGQWINKKLGITFTLVVDDFGIKYKGMKNLNHLINALQD